MKLMRMVGLGLGFEGVLEGAEKDEGEGREGVFGEAVTGGEVEVACWLFYWGNKCLGFRMVLLGTCTVQGLWIGVIRN